jgi:hypothetical protein
MLFLGGAYSFRGTRAIFHRARRPQREDIVRLLHSLSGSIVRLLERLCRYLTRPPVATKRLSIDAQERRFARLAGLVPRPRLNLTRIHGVFAPNFRHRRRIVLRQPKGRVDSDRPLDRCRDRFCTSLCSAAPGLPVQWMQRLHG